MYVRTLVCTLSDACLKEYCNWCVCGYGGVCEDARMHACMYVCMYVCMTSEWNLIFAFIWICLVVTILSFSNTETGNGLKGDITHEKCIYCYFLTGQRGSGVLADGGGGVGAGAWFRCVLMPPSPHNPAPRHVQDIWQFRLLSSLLLYHFLAGFQWKCPGTPMLNNPEFYCHYAPQGCPYV